MDAILFEPGNYIGDGSDTKFIFSNPTRLGNYCSDYDVMIPKKDTCELLECCGINGVVHQFMELEDYNVCEMCNKIVCSYCLAKLNEKKEEKCNQKHLCVECYNLSINDMKESNEASISQQRMILKDNHNIHDVNDLSTAEVLELYDFLVKKKSLSNDKFQPKYPMYAPSVLDHFRSKMVEGSYVAMT